MAWSYRKKRQIRKLRFFGDTEEFTLIELAKECSWVGIEEAFDAVANLQEGESIEIPDVGRIERVLVERGSVRDSDGGIINA